MEKRAYITISIDDGYPTDMRTAELLQKFGLEATFYIPVRNPEREVMCLKEVREVAKAFEVGSHTFNHKPLKGLSDREASAEINDGKRWLEDVLGREVVSFCYPQGKFGVGTIRLVKQACFLGARTCMLNLNSIPQDPFLCGVSTHGYSHSPAVQIRHALLEKNLQGVMNFIAIYKLAQDWAKHFRYGLDFVEKYGGVAHLYFHSWEMEGQAQWNKLESLLEIISHNKKLVCITNGDLFRLSYQRHSRWNERQCCNAEASTWPFTRRLLRSGRCAVTEE